MTILVKAFFFRNDDLITLTRMFQTLYQFGGTIQFDLLLFLRQSKQSSFRRCKVTGFPKTFLLALYE